MSQETRSDTTVSLRFSGTFDPGAITQRLGMQPTHVATRGELRRGVVRIKCDMWSSVIGGPAGDVDEALTQAFERLVPLVERVRMLHEISDEIEGTLLLAVTLVNDQDIGVPGIVMNTDWTRTLGEAGLGFEVDVTVLKPDS
jgi:hypothetical protein